MSSLGNKRLPVIVQSHFKSSLTPGEVATGAPLRTFEQETYIRNQQKLRTNLKNMKSRVDNKRPKFFNSSPSSGGGKKLQLEEGKGYFRITE